MNEILTEYLKSGQVHQKDLQIVLGQRQRYRIYMENKYIRQDGEIYKVQELDSIFYRVIDSIPVEGVGFTINGWEEVKFRNSRNANWMNWNFPKSVQFSHALFSVKNDDKRNMLFPNGDPYSRVAGHCEKLTEAFDQLPKLPSTYLLIMQAFDIVAFETFPCLIHSNEDIMKNPGKYVEARDISNKKNQIGMGLYSSDSYFQNGTFYFKFLGYGLHGDKVCSVFEYKCDGSTVNVEEGDSQDKKRKGKSYYSGTIILDVETGLPVSGTMLESYVSVQNTEIDGKIVKTPSHIRRDITLELLP